MAYLILVGMMGSGKSTVGKAVAERLGLSFDDTDKMLEVRLGRRIPDWFRLYGEQAFRDYETKLLQDLEDGEGVLATGGGIVVRDENWRELNRLGTTFFMDVELGVLLRRLQATKRRRPFMEQEGWEDKLGALLESRRPQYERADVVVKVGDEPLEDVADRIVRIVEGA
jgi:shikimate kinase